MQKQETKVCVDENTKSLSLSAVFRNLDLAVVLSDEDYRIVYANPFAEQLFEYPLSEIIGQNIDLLFFQGSTNEGQLNANEKNQRVTGLLRPQDWNSVLSESDISLGITKAQEVFECEVRRGSVPDNGGGESLFITVVQRVTDQLASERTLRELQRITSSRDLSFEQRIYEILELGRHHFKLPIGVLSKVEGDIYTVMYAIHPDNVVQAGMSYDLAATYCLQVMESDEAKGFNHFTNDYSDRHPCFQNFGLEAYIGAPIYVDGNRFGTITFSSPTPTQPFRARDLEILVLFAGWVGYEIARQQDLDLLERAHLELERLACEDPLTGLMNRRKVEQWLTTECLRSSRHELTMSVALIDVDHFKQVNDQYGHEMGDWVLKELAAICRETVRAEDAVARWGGEEFLFIFPHTGSSDVEPVLKRIADGFRSVKHPNTKILTALTLSAGIVQAKPDEEFSSIVSRADAALYQAKNSGRDRIVFGDKVESLSHYSR